MLRFLRILLPVLALGAGTLHAVPMAGVTYPARFAYGNAGNYQAYSIGWAFEVSQAISVTALGLFDDAQNGLADPHAIGLWSTVEGAYSGTLLASTVIPEGTAAYLEGQFRYVNIASVMLQPGQLYVIGAFYDGIEGYGARDPDPEDRDSYRVHSSSTTVTYGAEILYKGPRVGSQQAPDLRFPWQPRFDTMTPYAGPNFLYTLPPPPPVPEGGATGMTILALAGMLVAGRRGLRRAHG